MKKNEPVPSRMKAWKKFVFVFLMICLSLPSCTGALEKNDQPVGPGGVPLKATLTHVPPKGDVPKVKEWKPGDNAELIVNGDITISFSEFMDPTSTELAFRMMDDTDEIIEGRFEWLFYNRDLKFIPSQLLSPGRTYQIMIGESAKSAGGKTLLMPFFGSFRTTNRLDGSTVVPFDGDNHVPVDAVIRVIFPSPVVSEALTKKTDVFADLLQIEPPVSGKGYWETASIYHFQPDGLLPRGVRYKITVPSSRINQIHPENPVLKSDITWQFQTVPPTVKEISIASTIKPKPTDHFLPGDRFQIQFDEAMDQSSVEQNVILWDTSEKIFVPVSYSWEKGNQTVGLTPVEPLVPGRWYNVTVLAGTRTQSGGTFVDANEKSFQALPVPGVDRVYPKEKDSGDYSETFTVYFRSKMNEESLKGRLIIDPPLPAEAVAGYSSSMEAFVFQDLQPQVAYTVTVLPGVKDVYGIEMKEPYVARFTNGNKPSSLFIQLPIQAPILYRVDGKQEFQIDFTNLKSLDYRIYRLPDDHLEFLDLYHDRTVIKNISLGEERLVWAMPEQNLGKPNESVRRKVAFSGRDGKSLPPGYYLLKAASESEDPDSGISDWRIFAVVEDNITYKISARETLAWVTKLKTGAPVYKARVQLFNIKNELLGEARTDENGLASIPMPQPFNQNTSYYLVSNEEGFGFAHSDWGTGNLNYDQLSITKFTEQVNKPVIYLYSDRPIYRPGMTVNYKGVLRLSNDFSYSLPGSSPEMVEIKIEDYSGKRVSWQMLPLSSYKTLEGKFALMPTAALGNYTLTALVDGKLAGQMSFNVAYYRTQAFEVHANVDRAHIAAGESVTVNLLSQYYTGGALSGADVNLDVTKKLYIFTPKEPALADFVFAEDDLIERAKNASPSSFGSFTLKTNDAGGSAQVLPPSPADMTNSEKYSVVATVSDPSGQMIYDTATFYTHPSQYQVGVRLDSKVSDVGAPRAASVVLLDWNEQPVSNQQVQLQILWQKWMPVEREVNGLRKTEFSVQKEPYKEPLLATTDVNGRAAIPFTVDQGGIYEIRVSAVDGQGKTAKASTIMVVGAAKRYIAFKSGSYQNVNIVTDKKEYKIGEPVRLFIQTSFQGVSYALITVERASIKDKKVVRIEGNNYEDSLTVLPDWAPNVFVSVTVVKGVDENVEGSRPQFAVGSTEIRVNRDNYKLKFDLKVEPSLDSPEKGMALRIFTMDTQGQPVPAEVSLAMIDKATLAGMNPDNSQMTDFYYSAHQLQVQTNIPMLLLAEEYNYRLDNQIPTPTGELSGGGGELKGGSSLGVMSIRDDFRDTASWQPQIETNKDGEAVVYVNLPDNLTTWQIDLRGATRGGETTQTMKVGQQTFDIKAKLPPLFLQTHVPAYFVAGDQAVITAIVHNSTAELLQGKVSLAAEGVALAEPSSAIQEVTIPASQAVYVQWPITVSTSAQYVNLDFSVVSGDVSDRTKNTQDTSDPRGIPVLHYLSPSTASMSGILKSGDEQTVPFEGSGAGNSDLVVQLSPSLFSSMQDGFASNLQGTAGSTEEVASRIISAASLLNYLQTLKQPSDEQQKKLQDQSMISREELHTLQNSGDGGWGWLAGQTSQEMPTAYALLSILSTKDKKDYPQVSLEKAINFLEMVVQLNNSLRLPQHYNTRAFSLYVLSLAGRPRPSDVSSLYSNMKNLSIYGRAFLAMTIYKENSSDARLQTLMDDLKRQAKAIPAGIYWQESFQDDWNWNSNVRTTSIVMQAMRLIEPNNSYNEQAVRWLISSRKIGQWQSSQENAWCTQALTDWAIKSGEEPPNYQVNVRLNNVQFASTSFGPANFSRSVEGKSQGGLVLPGQINQLTVQRTKGPGLLYYAAYADSQMPVDQVTEIDHGIIIRREFFRPDDLINPVGQAAVNDLLVVRLQILVPSDLRFVTLEDYIPAGAEAIVWRPGELTELPQYFRWKGIYAAALEGSRYFPFAEVKQEKVILYANKLSAGSYVYTYMIRAATPGAYHLLPAVIRQTYNPAVFGQSAGDTITLKP